MSSGIYNKRITLEVNNPEQTTKGSKERWVKVKTFYGSCLYTTSRFTREGQVLGETEAVWVIRTHYDVQFVKKLGNYRFLSGKMILYPRMFPMRVGDESRIDTYQAEDL